MEGFAAPPQHLNKDKTKPQHRDISILLEVRQVNLARTIGPVLNFAFALIDRDCRSPRQDNLRSCATVFRSRNLCSSPLHNYRGGADNMTTSRSHLGLRKYRLNASGRAAC